MSSQSIMTEILEPNRIHTLPVQVSYHLPSTSQIFTTLLPSPQQVYVYPAAPSSSSASSSKEAEESWGSIYLKTVVQGVIMSSPEYLPLSSNPSTDLSLYTFDPRETYLRKSRATIHPPHLRRSAASSPLLASPDINNGPQQTQAGGEVWTGKGLVSKALEEPGLGKNLITGRLVRRKEFSVTHGNVDPLKALMQANEGGCWGIEVSLGLRNGQGHVQSFGLGQQSQSQFGSRSTSPMPMPMPTPQAIASGSSAPPMYARHSYPAVPQQSRRPTIPTSRTTSYLPPSSDRVTSSTPARPPPTRKPVTKKRPTPPPRHLSTVDTNSRAPTKTAAAGPGLPLDIPRHVYDNPDLLTKEQAERLIASPFFLNKLSEMTGQPLVPIVKREREDDTPQSSKKARAKQEEKQTCYNCGRVNNHVWRHMTLDDGSTTVTICNACGLYRNRHGVMRPPAMWDRVDEEIKPLRPPMPSSELDLPAQRLDSGFKRTMSSVVEKDAKRLASSSGRKPVATRAMPMTSPPRGSRSVSKSARHSASRVQQQPAASSPGPFNRGNRTPAHQPLQQAFVFNPDDSPNTTLNKIIGASMPMQSLDMPLSDDGREREGPQMPWTNKTNTNTNTNTNRQNQNHHNVNTPYQNNHDNRNNNNAIERFEMSAGPHGATSLKSPSPPPKFHRTSSTASRRFQHQHQHQPSGGTDEDDVLSQLFNRTSSIGPLGSSPAPFDFSQLPPSSPPASNGPSSDIDLELGHSAMLLSSPDISPASSHHTHKRISPEKKSNLNQSFTPDDLNLNHNIETKTGGGGQEPPSYDYDIEELWSKLQSQYDQQHQGGGGMESSGQIAEGLLGQMAQGGEEDFLALFNSLTNDNAH